VFVLSLIQVLGEQLFCVASVLLGGGESSATKDLVAAAIVCLDQVGQPAVAVGPGFLLGRFIELDEQALGVGIVEGGEQATEVELALFAEEKAAGLEDFLREGRLKRVGLEGGFDPRDEAAVE
jgi:hypothetical protein